MKLFDIVATLQDIPAAHLIRDAIKIGEFIHLSFEWLLYFGVSFNWARPTNGSDRDSLRDHDLPLIVRRHAAL